MNWHNINLRKIYHKQEVMYIKILNQQPMTSCFTKTMKRLLIHLIMINETYNHLSLELAKKKLFRHKFETSEVKTNISLP